MGFEAVHEGPGRGQPRRSWSTSTSIHAVHQSVLAHGVYKRDVDYIVEEGEVFIVDEFTGRVSEDKRFADGLHQAHRGQGARARCK